MFWYLRGQRNNLLGVRTGGAQPNISQQVIRSLSLPLPKLAEQQKIVSEIERHFSIADKIEQTIEKSLKESERLRQSILKKAFEGKLVEQNPEDEPAEKLLERIRAEKVVNTKSRKAAL